MTSNRKLWITLALAVVCGGAAIWLLTLWLPGWLTGTRATTDASSSAASPAPASSGDARRISATLFYVSSTGDALVAVEQDVPYASAPADQARRIVEHQLSAAPAGHISPIPAGTTLRALFLTSRGEAYVDVSGEIVTAHAGGSLQEALTVYAIVNALTVNLPDITAVQVLVDGHEVDTLVGHLDLRHPLKRGIRWVTRTP